MEKVTVTEADVQAAEQGEQVLIYPADGSKWVLWKAGTQVLLRPLLEPGTLIVGDDAG